MSLTVASAVARATSSSGGTVTTSSFTPAAGILLVACVGTDTASQTGVTHTVTGGGLTWTQQAHADKDTTAQAARSGAASIWTAVATGGAVTVTAGGGPDAVSVQPYTVSGQAGSPIGPNTGIGTTTTASTTASIFTSTAAGSVAFVSSNDWAQTGVATSTDLTLTTYNVSGLVGGFSGYKTLGGAGAQTAQFTYPGAPDGMWAAIEVLDGGGTVYLPPRVLVLPGGAVHRAATW